MQDCCTVESLELCSGACVLDCPLLFISFLIFALTLRGVCELLLAIRRTPFTYEIELHVLSIRIIYSYISILNPSVCIIYQFQLYSPVPG
jgi:hypothetical protein